MSSNQSPGVTAPSNSKSVEEELVRLAGSDVAAFLTLFKQTRDSHKEEATRACLRYLAVHGTDTLGRRMQVWLAASKLYLHFLLDPDFLSPDEVVSLTRVMRDGSANFVSDVQRQITQSKAVLTPGHLDRALQVCEAALGDPGILISWLRSLTRHGDPEIRLKAAKMLCEIRPNLRMIESQLKSGDARIRANALESLWSTNDPGASGLLTAALADDSNRVVMNALVGLNLIGAKGAFDRLLARANHVSAEVRLGAVWALRFLEDKRGIPPLKKLARDPAAEVAAKALEALASFGVVLTDEELGAEETGEEGQRDETVPTGPTAGAAGDAAPKAGPTEKEGHPGVARKTTGILNL